MDFKIKLFDCWSRSYPEDENSFRNSSKNLLRSLYTLYAVFIQEVLNKAVCLK